AHLPGELLGRPVSVPEVLPAEPYAGVHEHHPQPAQRRRQRPRHPSGPAADDGEIVRLTSRLSGTDDGAIVRRNPLGRRGRVAGQPVATSSPGRASMRQARSTGPPLTLIRQSKQTPMPQNSPRRRPPKRVVRQARTPAACRAAPMVWPGRTGTGRPSTVISKVIGPPRSGSGRDGTGGGPGRAGRR